MRDGRASSTIALVRLHSFHRNRGLMTGVVARSCNYLDGSIHWIITGCEQAHKDKRRQMDIDWVRDFDRQCKEVGIAHFFKQYYVGNTIMHDGVLDGVVRQK